MFSLIITIISIALVAALALATLYYGGTAFNQGRAGAEASRLINEGQQINAAATLNAATAAGATDIASLVTQNLLSTAPAGVSVTGVAPGDRAEVTVGADAFGDEVCAEVQRRAGAAALALADDAAADAGTQMYGCYGVAGAQTFFFKL